MTNRVWQRIGPWLTPALVLIEIVLVWTGALALRDAVVVVVVIEGLLVLTVLARLATMMRRYRAKRADGQDGWSAAEHALAQLVPPPAAHVLMYEVKIWVSLLLWPSRRRRHPECGHSYARSIRVPLFAVLGMVAVEATVVEVVLAVTLGLSVWTWVGLGVHLYTLVWIGGLLGSIYVRPHLVAPDGLRIRDGIFTELAIPYDALRRVTKVHRSNIGRSGLKVDRVKATALLAHGDGNVLLELTPDAVLTRNDMTYRAPFTEIVVTADDPEGFRHAVEKRRAAVTAPD